MFVRQVASIVPEDRAMIAALPYHVMHRIESLRSDNRNRYADAAYCYGTEDVGSIFPVSGATRCIHHCATRLAQSRGQCAPWLRTPLGHQRYNFSAPATLSIVVWVNTAMCRQVNAILRKLSLESIDSGAVHIFVGHAAPIQRPAAERRGR